MSAALSARLASAKKSNGLVLLVAWSLVGLISWADHATGAEWSLFVGYVLPIALVVWKTEDRRLGVATAILCAVAWSLVQIGSPPHPRGGLGALWELVSLVVYLAATVTAMAAMRAHSELKKRARTIPAHTLALESGTSDLLQQTDRQLQTLGRDLHDGLGPHLAAIRYAADHLAQGLRQRGQPEAGEAVRIRDLCGDAVSLARDLARGIFPVAQDGSGLSSALEDLALSTSRLSGMAVSFSETGDKDPWVGDPVDGMHLYRIAQEAVNNASKHGGATTVAMILSKGDDTLRLAIVDDGHGLASDAISQDSMNDNSARSMGWQSMQHRAHALGGEISIDSNPGGGVIVSCTCPNACHRLRQTETARS